MGTIDVIASCGVDGEQSPLCRTVLPRNNVKGGLAKRTDKQHVWHTWCLQLWVQADHIKFARDSQLNSSSVLTDTALASTVTACTCKLTLLHSSITSPVPINHVDSRYQMAAST